MTITVRSEMISEIFYIQGLYRLMSPKVYPHLQSYPILHDSQFLGRSLASRALCPLPERCTMRLIAVSRWNSRTPIALSRVSCIARDSATSAPARMLAPRRKRLQDRELRTGIWMWMRRDSKCPRGLSLTNLQLTPLRSNR